MLLENRHSRSQHIIPLKRTMTYDLTLKCDLQDVMTNQHAKCLG